MSSILENESFENVTLTIISHLKIPVSTVVDIMVTVSVGVKVSS